MIEQRTHGLATLCACDGGRSPLAVIGDPPSRCYPSAMLKSNWLSQIGIAVFALLLAGTWLRHLAAVRVHAGVHYTYCELILFSVSVGACIFLSSRRWGRAANIFIDGWAVATLLAAVLHMTFNWLQLSPAPGLPW